MRYGKHVTVMWSVKEHATVLLTHTHLTKKATYTIECKMFKHSYRIIWNELQFFFVDTHTQTETMKRFNLILRNCIEREILFMVLNVL